MWYPDAEEEGLKMGGENVVYEFVGLSFAILCLGGIGAKANVKKQPYVLSVLQILFFYYVSSRQMSDLLSVLLLSGAYLSMFFSFVARLSLAEFLNGGKQLGYFTAIALIYALFIFLGMKS